MPDKAKKLKEAFRKGEISISKLFEMTSKQRVEKLSQYVDKETAKFFVSKLERGYMMPRQKQAMRSTIYEMFGEKPLYQGVSIDKAKTMAKELNMADLKKMTEVERANTLSKYLSKDLSEKLSKRFEDLKISGNLKIWEQKTLGTETLREQAHLKGSLAKLEALNDMGVLNPKEIDDFMQTFVEDKLKLNITPQQAKELSRLTEKSSDLYDKLYKSNDFTHVNENVFRGYLQSVKDVRAYQQSLIPDNAINKVNTAIDYARASILGSYRIIRNSFLYQAIPTLERYITKRIIPAGIGDKELTTNIGTMLNAKMFSARPSGKDLEFIKNQVAMATRIYRDTGFEIARMENLDDGYNLFGGERFGTRYGKPDSDNKLRRAFDIYVDAVIKSPKWTAGGTDMIAANMQRADTAIMMSKEFAYLEASKKTFKDIVARDKWIENRSHELLVDSYSFTPKDPKAAQIRAQGILDAHLSNSTQASGLAELVIKMRDSMKVKGINFGKAIVPFARIATTTIARGVDISILPGDIARRISNINRAGKLDDTVEAGKIIRKNINMMVGNIGLALTTIILASFLDEDDYIGSWDTIRFNEHRLAQARGAGAGHVRIGGKWIPIRYLPIINIPLAAIMQVRQSRARGNKGLDNAGAFMGGILGGILDTPVIKEISSIVNNMQRGASSSETVKMIDSLGLDGKSLFEWAKIRALPSVISYDLFNAAFPKDARYDFLGEETGKNKLWIGFRADQSNEITLEFNRLNNVGQLPTISDPKKVDIIEEIGEKEYYEMLSRLKQNYADAVSKLINDRWYQGLTDERKKQEIDKLRKREILDKLK